MENSTTLYSIQTLRERIRRIYQELDQVTTELADLEQSILPPAEQEFHAAFPNVPLDHELLALVGSQPARTIEQDKTDLRESMAVKFG